MAGYVFINEAGTSLDLHDRDLSAQTGTYRVIERESSGWGLPTLATRSNNRGRRAGVELRGAQIPPRVVTLPVMVFGSSHNDLMDDVRGLIAHVAGSYGRSTARPGFLQVTPAGESARKLRCIGTVAGKNHAEVLDATTAIVRLSFFAPHPNWYVDTEQSDSIVIGTGGLVWPVTWPVNWGLDGFSGGATVANDGEAETRSLLWSVPGPVTGPALTNVTVDRYVRFPGLIVPEGFTLKVRMGWRPDGVTEHKAVIESVGGAETNVLGYLDQGSNFFHLEPGDNEMVATEEVISTNTHTLGWYEEYFSV